LKGGLKGEEQRIIVLSKHSRISLAPVGLHSEKGINKHEKQQQKSNINEIINRTCNNVNDNL